MKNSSNRHTSPRDLSNRSPFHSRGDSSGKSGENRRSPYRDYSPANGYGRASNNFKREKGYKDITDPNKTQQTTKSGNFFYCDDGLLDLANDANNFNCDSNIEKVWRKCTITLYECINPVIQPQQSYMSTMGDLQRTNSRQRIKTDTTQGINGYQMVASSRDCETISPLQNDIDSTQNKNRVRRNSSAQSESEGVKDSNSDIKSKEAVTKLIYNMDIILSPSRPGDRFLLESFMDEAMLVHNEIVRRVNSGESLKQIKVSSLREIIYIAHDGMNKHQFIHYLTDLQISHIISEIGDMLEKLSFTHGLQPDQIHLNPLTQLRFLNFRRLGLTHWIDFQNRSIRLLGLPMHLKVKGLELLEKCTSVRIGSLRLLRKGEGFAVSMQCFFTEKDLDEFNRQCLLASNNSNKEERNGENKTKNSKTDTYRDVEDLETNESLPDQAPDYKLIEALRDKYNRNKDADRFDNTPRFLKGTIVAS